MDIKTPTLAELLETYKYVRASIYEDVQGVLRLDSGKPGPVLGITVSTHGNELSAYAAVADLLKHREKILANGSVLIVINNMAAAEQYVAGSAEERKATTWARYNDIDMNRLPENLEWPEGAVPYEVRRARELQHIWRECDFGVDMHNTPILRHDPMLIVPATLSSRFFKGFPAQIVISNIDRVQSGNPAMHFYGTPGKTPVMAVECCSHDNPQSHMHAIMCIRALMYNLGMLRHGAWTPPAEPQTFYEYFVDEAIRVPNRAWLMSRVFRMFEEVKAGQVIAYNGAGTGTILAPLYDGHIIMAPPSVIPDRLAPYETAFLTRSVRTFML